MMTIKGGGLGVIGGPQGPKALLDAVRQAVTESNIDILRRLARDFMAIDDNVAKCLDEHGNTICHLALGKSTYTLQFVIAELRADVNAPDFQGRTPLHEAVTRNYVECCEVLLANGADGSIQSATLSTPFHTAAACGSVECMEALLRHSENPVEKVNELDKNRNSALHKCAFDGDVRVSRWLVEHGAVVDARDNLDVTPLLVAVKMGQRDVTRYLLEQRADCNRQDRQGNTGVHFCAIRCDTAILRMLLDTGANANIQNAELNTPLHLAALHQRPDSKEWDDLIAMLLVAGCDPFQENASRKKADDYVGRSLKRLFTKEEVERRQKQEEAAQREFEANMEAAIQLRTSWKERAYADVQRRRQLEQAEDDRLARENEERTRVEEDARTMLDETIEAVRFQEEEIKRKKALLEKATTKK